MTTVAPVPALEDRTAGWLTDHLARCAPGTPDGGPDMAGLQALAELSLAAALGLEWNAAAAPDVAVAPEVLTAWLDWCAARCAEPWFAELPRAHPSSSTVLVAPYLHLRRAGRRLPGPERTLQWLLGHGVLDAVELVPHRALDRAYTLFSAGVAAEPDWRELYDRTHLARQRDPLLTDDAATLSVTHTLFFLTDFGRRPLPPWVGGAETALLLDGLLVHACRLEDWDTVAELLLAMAVSGQGGTVYEAGRAAFLDRHRADGGVDCRGDSGGCFHATFLSFLHSGVCRVRRRRPPG